jgi:hypothetical protein
MAKGWYWLMKETETPRANEKAHAVNAAKARIENLNLVAACGARFQYGWRMDLGDVVKCKRCARIVGGQ